MTKVFCSVIDRVIILQSVVYSGGGCDGEMTTSQLTAALVGRLSQHSFGRYSEMAMQCDNL